MQQYLLITINQYIINITNENKKKKKRTTKLGLKKYRVTGEEIKAQVVTNQSTNE